MNKDEMKMIEDMARIICKETSNKGLCEKCDFKKHEQFGYIYQCRRFDNAESLYNAGYRKVDEDEIVIKKSEYDTLLKDYALTYDNAYKWGLKVGEEKTAIEILQKLKDNIIEVDFGCGAGVYEVVDMDTDELKELATELGIELED